MRVKIQSAPGRWYDTRVVAADSGELIEGIVSLTFRASATEVPTVVLEALCVESDIEADARVLAVGRFCPTWRSLWGDFCRLVGQWLGK